MPSSRRQKRVIKSLSNGRPRASTTIRNGRASLSASKGRRIIRAHHTISKAHAQAVKIGDHVRAAQLEDQLEAQGGLEQYQAASKVGQSRQRGGDSSRVLVEWLNPLKKATGNGNVSKLKMLEVGALSIENECSRSESFDVTRIDLHSQHKDILRQDFMERPLPSSEDDCFDIVSLSLVINYVPSPAQRGEMLKRIPKFLRPSTKEHISSSNGHFPSLFLVLPAPCVANSRYLNEDRLRDIMESIGSTLKHRKLTSKLVYYLWVFSNGSCLPKKFAKSEINPGQSRNNFAITLE